MNKERHYKQPLTLRRGCLIILYIIIAYLVVSCDQASSAQTPGAQPNALATRPMVPPLTPESTSLVPVTSSPTLGSSLPAAGSTLTPRVPSIDAPASANPASLPDPGLVQWAEVASGLDSPVGMANAADGSGRLFILERAGRVRVLVNGQLAATPYLDITDRVGSQGSEQGLLGLAFHPQFKQNGFFYMNYTDSNGNTVITRFHADPTGNQADPASQHDLLHVDQPYPNHNGGSMVFGPDGYLYMGLGDGGSQGDPNNNGQSVQTFLGKLLRVDVDHGDPYTIPPDNPFAKGGGRAEIWAYGLRNPWRIDFDPQTHDLFIADVGQDSWEEIDFLAAGTPGGANFGWSYREGMHDYKGNIPAGLQLIEPVFEYSHAEGGCSVTGGVVYRGQALPDWQAVYLFGDYCSGKIWGLRHQPDGAWLGSQLFDTSFAITSFGRDEQGEVYLVDQHGSLLKLVKR